MSTFKITIEHLGFAVWKEEHFLSRIMWSEIKEIIAYKTDLFTFDNVCFGFRTSDCDDYFTVDEEVVDFYDLEKELTSKLDGFDRLWRDKVILPAFALNRCTIYGCHFELD